MYMFFKIYSYFCSNDMHPLFTVIFVLLANVQFGCNHLGPTGGNFYMNLTGHD